MPFLNPEKSSDASFARREGGAAVSAASTGEGLPLRTTLQRRRVLFLDHTAVLGGGEIALFNLVRRLDKSRYEPVVALFSEGPLAGKLKAEGVETHILALPASVVGAAKDTLGLRTLMRGRDVLETLRFVWKLRRFIARRRVDLVHTNSLKSDLLGGAAARMAGATVIWHVRDRIESDYLPAPIVRLFRFLCRRVPHYVVANSQATLRSLRLSQGQGATVPSGVDLARFKAVVHDGTDVPASERDGSGGTAGVATIGLVGRISPWKGQHVFVRAAAEVLRRFPDCRFEIIGSALFAEHGYEAEVRALAATLGIGHAVRFTGFQNDVQACIAQLDILVHASTTGEPFGQVVIEGMAAGKPVVATNGGGIPEIVLDPENGYLVPMGDHSAMAEAVVRLVADPAAAAAMGRRGRRRVLEHFTIERTALNVQEIYDRLLHRRA